MQAHQKKAPTCVAIVGPTASGKTAAAIKIAEAINGEIICADSRTIYRGLDIGTAKPTCEERCRVKHWGLDLVNPGEKYSAALFQSYAKEKIQQIRKRGAVPIIVGGTGLYVDSVVLDYTFPPKISPQMDAWLNKMSIQQLHKYCNNNNIPLPENHNNKRHVIHAIATKDITISSKDKPDEDTIVVGISTEKNILRERIIRRADAMIRTGVVEEATSIAHKYGMQIGELPGSIYKYIDQLVRGEITEQQMIELFSYSDIHLAKRQMTWFKRRSFIQWCEADDVVNEVVQYFTIEQ